MPQFAGDKHDPSLAVGDGDPRRLSQTEHKTEIPPFYDGTATAQEDYYDASILPTEEELRTLRRVSDKIPFKAYTIAFVELVERMSYYGTIQVSFIAFCNSFFSNCE